MTDQDLLDDRSWFRSHLDPIVDGDERVVDDGWPTFAASLTDQEPTVPVPLRPHRRPRRALLAVAAAILVAAAIGAVVIASGNDDKTTKVATTPDLPTGWFIPVGLPDSWKLESAWAHPGKATCARHGVQWTDVAGRRSVGLSFDACGSAPTEDDLPDLGEGMEGLPRPHLDQHDLGDGKVGIAMAMMEQDPNSTDINRPLTWNADGGAWNMMAVGVTEDELLDLARQAAAGTDPADVALPGFELAERWSAPERQRAPEVQLVLTNPDGLQAEVQLHLPGDGIRPAGDSVLVSKRLPGQPNEIWRYDPRTFWAVRYGGAWPGADISVLRLTTGPTDPKHMITDEGLETLIASLRPATAEEWRRFLATGEEVSPILTQVDSLADLAGRDFPPPDWAIPPPDGETPTTAAPTTTTSTTNEPATTTTAAPTTSTSVTTSSPVTTTTAGGATTAPPATSVPD